LVIDASLEQWHCPATSDLPIAATTEPNAAAFIK
jgi:hypothetical protein